MGAQLDSIRKHEDSGRNNELVFSARSVNRRLPSSILAFFYTSDSSHLQVALVAGACLLHTRHYRTQLKQ